MNHADRRINSMSIPAALALALSVAGCSAAGPAGEPDMIDEDDAVHLSGVSSRTVDDILDEGSCGTSDVRGLSLQIFEEARSIDGASHVEVPAVSGVRFGENVFPYLQGAARDALIRAAQDHPGRDMFVTSMLRSVAQQYLLYGWYQRGWCSDEIYLAASPGNSKHESGLAVDINEYWLWTDILPAYGFQWQGESDPVHFTYVGEGAQSTARIDVLAFQRLWNRDHPEDLIDEDGIWGNQTAARLGGSPAEGFMGGPGGGACGSIGPLGACDGNTVVWCESDKLNAYPCTEYGLTCMWVNSQIGYGCL